MSITSKRWEHRTYEYQTKYKSLGDTLINLILFSKKVKGEKFPSITGHKYSVTFDFFKFFLVLVTLISLIGIFSRNIDKKDIFKDKQNIISGTVLSLLLATFVIFVLLVLLSAYIVFLSNMKF